MKTKEEAERAIAELSGQEVLERKVSVQLARKPGTVTAKRERYNHNNNNNAAAVEGEQQEEDGEHPQQQGGGRKQGSFRGRGRGRGRGGRVSTRFSLCLYQILLTYVQRGAGNRANGVSSTGEGAAEEGTTPAANVLPLTEPVNTSQAATGAEAPSAVAAGHTVEGDGAPSGFRGKRRRGPPENGVPSATKVMVANLPYELSEEKVSSPR